jgi:hypothetical protein
MRERRGSYRVLALQNEGRDRLECQGVDGRMVLKMEEVPYKSH